MDYFETLDKNYQRMIDESKLEVLTLDASKSAAELVKEASDWVEHKVFERGVCGGGEREGSEEKRGRGRDRSEIGGSGDRSRSREASKGDRRGSKSRSLSQV